MKKKKYTAHNAKGDLKQCFNRKRIKNYKKPEVLKTAGISVLEEKREVSKRLKVSFLFRPTPA